MTTLTLNLDLGEEEMNAIIGVVDVRNTDSGTSVTVERHLTEVCMAEVLRYKAAAYAASVEELATGAAILPYEARKEVTAFTREKIMEFLSGGNLG